MVLEKLDPKIVWQIFEDIFLQTPHESKHEEKIREKIKTWVANVAQKYDANISISEDSVGNLLIKKPASPDMENTPAIMLQGHMDMVCVSNDPFDFDNSPITPEIEENGEWITAHGTSLGADNGVGVSMALAALIDSDPNFVHGPLEVLVTVDEETGLTGAFNVDVEKLQIESRLMINVDSEAIGVITIGSSGGGDSKFEKTLERSSDYTTFSSFYQLKVSGLLGGHSGGDIHLPRANANKLIARILSKVILNKGILVISEWNGGTKHNAITRNSQIVFGIDPQYEKEVLEGIEKEKKALYSYYREGSAPYEPHMEIKLEKTKSMPYFSPEESTHIVYSANLIPSQAIVPSPSIAGLTETSNNFAIVKTTATGILFHLSSRSSIAASLEWVRDQIEQIALISGWIFTREEPYPGWNPEPENSFLKYVKQVYEEALGREVEIAAIHGGLETGVIGAKIPGISMVSIGPDIQSPHSPDERVKIKSVEIFYNLIKKMLASIKTFK